MSSWWRWLIFEALLQVLDPVVPEIVVLRMIQEALEATALVVALVGAVHVMNVLLLISWPVVVLSHRQIHQAHCTGNTPKWVYSCLILHPVCEDSLDPLNNDPHGDRHWKSGSVLIGECSIIHICIHIFIPKLIYIPEVWSAIVKECSGNVESFPNELLSWTSPLDIWLLCFSLLLNL